MTDKRTQVQDWAFWKTESRDPKTMGRMHVIYYNLIKDMTPKQIESLHELVNWARREALVEEAWHNNAE